MRSTLVLLAVLSGAVSLQACASQECDFNSQCGMSAYCLRGRCRQDCREDLDCSGGEVCSEIGQCTAPSDGGPTPDDAGPLPPLDAGPEPIDAGPPVGFDAGPPPPTDAGAPPVDAGAPPQTDAGPPAPDAGPMRGTSIYLDRCTTDFDCALPGTCVLDVGGTRMCTRPCTTHRDCASEHVCDATGVCVRDDTGTNCSVATPGTCALGNCVANSMSATGHCTRDCVSAADCPSGYACAAAGATRVCMNIEMGCAGGAVQCVSGVCLSVQGCTAECRNAADCPQRFSFLPAYTCARAFGSANPICVPPTDVIGSDPIGAVCPAVGTVRCRSGACDTSAPLGPMCTQSCTQEGGCGPGLGCWPQVDVGSITFLCSRAGSGAFGATCTTGRQCDSGLCDTMGFCTRLCTDDGLCATGMRCETVPGFSVALCRR